MKNETVMKIVIKYMKKKIMSVGSGSGILIRIRFFPDPVKKIMDMDLDPFCSERLNPDPDPVKIRLDPKP